MRTIPLLYRIWHKAIFEQKPSQWKQERKDSIEVSTNGYVEPYCIVSEEEPWIYISCITLHRMLSKTHFLYGDVYIVQEIEQSFTVHKL